MSKLNGDNSHQSKEAAQTTSEGLMILFLPKPSHTEVSWGKTVNIEPPLASAVGP